MYRSLDAAVYPVPTLSGRFWLTIPVILLLLSTLLVRQPNSSAVSPASPAIALDFGRIPLSFVPNAGQFDPAVRFVVQTGGGTVFFTQGEMVLSLANSPSSAGNATQIGLSVKFEDASAAPEVIGAEPLPGVVSYYLGNDPAQWRTNLPSYAGVVYRQLYPGIDLQFDGAGRVLKSTYNIAPGAKPDRIRWRYEGAGTVQVDAVTGDLLVTGQAPVGSTLDTTGEAAGGSVSLIEHAPVAWQTIDGQRQPVDVRYALFDEEGRTVEGTSANAGQASIGFALGSYDSSLPLLLDPTLDYSTYLGGSNSDIGYAIAVDKAGNAYVTGETYSTDWPGAGTPGGDADAFVAKLNATGTALVYSTYIGGSAAERGNAIAVDSAGNAYVTGSTASANFPTLNPAQAALSASGATNAFITKLNANGGLSYSTYVGNLSYEVGYGIAVDSMGSAYMAGNAFGDVLVVKLKPAGNAFDYWGSFGGTSDDKGEAIAIDSVGNAYVTGMTQSRLFPTTQDALQPYCDLGTSTNSYCGQDAFVAVVNAAGDALLYSTFLGGEGWDEGTGIALDSTGSIYVTGNTASMNFPAVNPIQTSPCTASSYCADIFVSKIDGNTGALAYSTILGGASGDFATGIAVDGVGRAHVVGTTKSADFPVSDPNQPGFGGGLCYRYGELQYCWDAFVLSLTPGGNALAYSSYLGGSGEDQGQGIAVDSAGNAYVTGFSRSTNFPTTAGVLKPSFGGEFREAFVVKIAPGSGPGPNPPPNPNLTKKVYVPSVTKNGP